MPNELKTLSFNRTREKTRNLLRFKQLALIEQDPFVFVADPGFVIIVSSFLTFLLTLLDSIHGAKHIAFYSVNSSTLCS